MEKSAELTELLSQSDEHFRLLVESVRDYAIYLLDPAGIVRSWNLGAERIKGYRADEVVGQHFSLFYPDPKPSPAYFEQLLARAREEGRVELEEFRTRKDGSRFWAHVVLTALFDRGGRHLGFAKVTEDQTNRSYRAFVEATNAIIWTVADGRPNADSPSWRAFTGQTREEWLGLRGWEPVHPDDQPRLRADWARAKQEGRIFEAEFRLRRHDGVFVWMAARAVPFLDLEGNVREWFGVTVDVSERKRSELALADALERERAARIEAERVGALWTTTLHSIGDAVISTDTAGLVTFMNPIAEQLTRFSAADALGRPLSEVFRIVNEETRTPVENPVEKVLREGAVVGLANHTVLLARDGRAVPIDDSAAPIRDVDGKLLGVVMVFRDVSREKLEASRRQLLAHAGEALAQSTDYRTALAAIVELAVPRLADWCALDVLEPGESTPRRLAVAHVEPAKVSLARELARRYPPDPHATTGVANVIRTGRSELYAEIPRELLDAAAVDDEHRRLIDELELRSAVVVPLRGRERVFGAITFVYAESGRNYGEEDLLFVEELARRAALVIERRKLEEERAMLLESERAARAQAELASRAKDEFLAIVSHELRNPLNAILGWARLLSQRDLPADVLKSLATIERNARAQARLIDDVLDVSRIISGKLRLDLAEASVVHAVADAVEAARPLAEAKQIELSSDVAPDISLTADQVRLQQIIGNLLSNAVKFTPSGGRVRVTAKRAGSRATITVEDTGDGIEAQFLSAIFEPFRQADASTTRRHGGLGLGLAIVRRLVEAHGGRVRAESAGKGKGATFIVELPAHSGSERPAPGSSEAQNARAELAGVRALVVDDDRDAVELVEAVLVGAGAEVQTAQSGAEALRGLRQFKPTLMVSDIGMPEMDGYELIARVRSLPAEEGGQIPAVALTAYVRAEDAARALAAGFQLHLPKPVDSATLVRAVAKLSAAAPRA